MKITIRHPAGLEFAFEGDEAEFQHFSSLLGQLPTFVGTVRPADASGMSQRADEGPFFPANGEKLVYAGSGTLDVHALAQQLAAVGASTDIERVTVMTWMAEQANLDGLDYGTAERLYDELGQPKPSKMRATFSNAKTRGLVRSVGQGRWKTTVAGQNFARYGTREARGRRSALPSRSQGALPMGGGGDD